ncbi:MAG: DNA translocase FtsK [Synergistes sp.]|nr:DNA translocase FtsK [Synergistes sp.]
MRETHKTTRRQRTEKFCFKEIVSNGILNVTRGIKALLFVLMIFVVFSAVSVYTNLTGDMGSSIASFLLVKFGGAVIIPLIFIFVFCVAAIFFSVGRRMIKYALGTLCLYLFAAMLLGLNRITHDAAAALHPTLSAGEMGIALSLFVYKTIGAFGTLITGLILIYLVLFFYGVPVVSYIKGIVGHFAEKRENGRGARAVQEPVFTEDDSEELAEENNREEIYEDNSFFEDTDSAPNISECGVTDYFACCEDKSRYDTVAVSEMEAGSGREKDSYDNGTDSSVFDEDEIDYNDPESVKKAEEKDAALVQDPNFNLQNDSVRGIKQGIFPPPIDLFGPEENREGEIDEEKARPLGNKIISTFAQFGIEAELAEILVGPTVIQFRIQLAPGIKVSKVAALANDIALAMAVTSLRIEAPIPGKPYVGIEIPNPKRRGIPLRTVLEDEAFAKTHLSLPLPFGIAVNGDSVIVGLEELPHLLVAGTTGSGKSVFINSCVVGLCSKRRPEELRMILVDPKRVEMAVYDKLPHLLTPPVTDPKKAVQALAWLIREMETRYTSFAKIRVRNLEGYNAKVLPKDKLPHIVIVVDELADLMMTAAKEVEGYICRLAQMARATGIHLMLATQRPSVNIITGLIKANVPARVAFTLPSNADSRTIIDCAGAEKLLGKGDMLFSSTKHPKPIRVQSPWIDDKILSDWLAYMTNTFGAPDFINIEAQGNSDGGEGGNICDDSMLSDAVDMVMSTGIASASGLQRRLRIGFSRASRLIDVMEQLGIVGPADGSHPREILVDEETAKDIVDNVLSSGE